MMAAMEIVQIRMGAVTLPPQHPRAGSDYPLYGYLIRHADGPVLVDTGCGPGHSRIDELFNPEDIDFAAALRDAGVELSDVTMLINTHLHFDHTGRNRLFPGIPIVAQRAEYEAAQEPGFTVPDWIDFPGIEWRLVDGRVEVLPGVEVMPTPSHTPGHQVVIVDLGDRIEVIAGQAVQDCDELETGESKEDLPRSGAESFASVARRIKDLQPARVWFSHDPRTWPCD